MTYISPAELAERPGAHELALLASPLDRAVIDFELMDATLRGTDRSTWSDDDIATADLALVRVLDAVAEASALIDGFLSTRYKLPLALSVTSAGKSLVTSWARSITRYLLNQNRSAKASEDTVVRDYEQALKLMRQCADGIISLGAGDKEAPGATSATDVRLAGAPTVFGRGQLKAFR